MPKITWVALWPNRIEKEGGTLRHSWPKKEELASRSSYSKILTLGFLQVNLSLYLWTRPLEHCVPTCVWNLLPKKVCACMCVPTSTSTTRDNCFSLITLLDETLSIPPLPFNKTYKVQDTLPTHKLCVFLGEAMPTHLCTLHLHVHPKHTQRHAQEDISSQISTPRLTAYINYIE